MRTLETESCHAITVPAAYPLSPVLGMEMVRGLMPPRSPAPAPAPPELFSRGGDTRDEGGENSYSAGSATRDWKYTRILVLGNRKEHLHTHSHVIKRN